MKMTIALLISAVAVSPLLSCPPGSIEYEGVCAAEPQAEGGGPSAKPSDEKPPTDKMPSYEREGIRADTPSSCAATNNCSDQKAIDADAAGKKAAGIVIGKVIAP